MNSGCLPLLAFLALFPLFATGHNFLAILIILALLDIL